MKKKLNLFFTLCIALLFTACATDIENIEGTNTPKGEKKKMVFTAEKAPIDPTSRATIADDYSILWEEGDVITVFDGTNKNTFILVSGAGTTCAQFEGEALEADRYVALYGSSSSSTKLEGNKIRYTNSFYIATIKQNSFLMVAVSDSYNNMLFKSANAFAKITTVSPSKRIVVKGGEQDILGGYVDITIDDAGNPIKFEDSWPQYTSLQYNFIQLVNGNGFVGTYLIPIIPGTLSELNVSVEDTEGNLLTRRITHEIHNFETPGVVIDFGTASKENGWDENITHIQSVCVQHYALGQGKAQAEQVNLGLPSGLKWSSVNLGATSPEKYGDYYAWGATVPWLESYDQNGNVSSITTFNDFNGVCQWNPDHNSYNTANIPFALKTTNMQTDPNSWSKYFPGRDDKTVLEPKDDAAVKQWGDGWRMPTDKEFNELASNCYWEWCENYNGTGIHGVIVYKAKQDADKGIFHNGSVWKKTTNGLDYVTSSQPDGFNEYSILTDKYIFLPQPGLVDGRTIALSGEYGRYWSSTLSLFDVNSSYSNNARYLYFSSNGLYDQSAVGEGGNAGRVLGQPIRPVHE